MALDGGAGGQPVMAGGTEWLGHDMRVPSPARMYDYYLGGKDNSPADREAAERALSVLPSGRLLARANRDFMARAVKCLAAQGIAHESVAVFRNSVPSGSFLVVSHVASDGSDPAVMRAVRDAYADATAPAVFRSMDDIERFFDGFGLLQPGLTDVAEWRSGWKPEPAEIRFVGGVGRKP